MNQRACETVGIDLGTTYSALAYLDDKGTPRVVCDGEGRSVMPSVVYFDDREVVVGELALEQSRNSSERIVQFIKLHMGDAWRKEIQGQVHCPESISALILRQLVREAAQQIGTIRKAVVTVPAYFTERRRRATEQAGEIAGLEVVSTLNEPMAACLAHGLHRGERPEVALVYDLGGGTFDVTVVRAGRSEIEELATTGNRQLGGRDWDQALIDDISEEFARSQGIDPRATPQGAQDLILECEHAKRRLTRLPKTLIRVQTAGIEQMVEVTRERFESLTAHLLHSTKLTSELALEDAGLTWNSVDRVLLVGGSTHMPAVRRMLHDLHGRPPETAVNPVLAVALGAAIYAHLLDRGQELKTRPVHVPDAPSAEVTARTPVFARSSTQASAQSAPAAALTSDVQSVQFVTAHGVGVKIRERTSQKNVVLIPRNTKVPATVTRRFLTTSPAGTTARSSQHTSIQIEITQGDSTDAELVEPLGRGRISGLPAGQHLGNPVDVTLQFDSQGRLHAQATYAPTGQAVHMTVDVQGCLKPDEVEFFREFMGRAGVAQPFNATEAIQRLDRPSDDDGDVRYLLPE